MEIKKEKIKIVENEIPRAILRRIFRYFDKLEDKLFLTTKNKIFFQL